MPISLVRQRHCFQSTLPEPPRCAPHCAWLQRPHAGHCQHQLHGNLHRLSVLPTSSTQKRTLAQKHNLTSAFVHCTPRSSEPPHTPNPVSCISLLLAGPFPCPAWLSRHRNQIHLTRYCCGQYTCTHTHRHAHTLRPFWWLRHKPLCDLCHLTSGKPCLMGWMSSCPRWTPIPSPQPRKPASPARIPDHIRHPEISLALFFHPNRQVLPGLPFKTLKLRLHSWKHFSSLYLHQHSPRARPSSNPFNDLLK